MTRTAVRRLGGFVIVLVFLAAARGAVQIARFAPIPSQPSEVSPGPRAVVGFHIHTAVDDGAGSLEEVVAAAKTAGLDAIVITDHDSFELLPEAGYVDGVLVVVGAELSTDDGHLVALGGTPAPFPASHDASATIADVHAGGGMAIVTHPQRRFDPALRWRGSFAAVDGVEIVNLDASWRVRPRPLRTLSALLAFPFAPERAIVALGSDERVRDGLPPSTGTLLAIGGSDAHGLVPSYRASLAAVANLVLLEEPLTGDAALDIRAVVEALSKRRVLVAFTAIADPRRAGFRAIGSNSGRRYGIGDEVDADELPMRLEFESGLDAEVELQIVDEQGVVARATGDAIAVEVVRPGRYRAVAWIDGPFAVPWLTTNDISIGVAGSELSSLQPSEMPPSEAPERALDLMEHLRIERDPRSVMTTHSTDQGLEVSYRLAPPGAVSPHVWCALVDRSRRDLRGHAAVVVQGSADPPIRLDVVIETSGRDGVRRYRRSIRFDPWLRAYRLPLASFRGGARATRELPRIDDVRAVLMTIDDGNATVGASGQLRVDGFWVD